MDIPNWRRLTALESDTLHVLGITHAEAEEAENLMNWYALDCPIESGNDRRGARAMIRKRRVIIRLDRMIEGVEGGPFWIGIRPLPHRYGTRL
ncbi:MAG: hypothetical protein ACE5OR_01245 [bacterium]